MIRPIMDDLDLESPDSTPCIEKEKDTGSRFTSVLFELPCYPQLELEIHMIEVSYFKYILIK